MTLEQVYSASSLIAAAGWICLVASPLARARLVSLARFFALALCAAYLTQMVTITEPTGGDFTTLAGVTELFSAPGNVMLGWTHYLAFDLFIGSWEVEDANREGLPHWAMIPILFLTFMLGPIGLIVYFVVRSLNRARRKRSEATA